ncbi:MAG: protein kinase [Chloroflexi bacterium]|nr:protein kinase [Chloroflexota bacterium]
MDVIGNRWQITGTIGEGGMGDVYRGEDLETGETVAIKLLKPDIVETSPTLVERFRRESELLRQLDHPNIVGVIGAVEENDLYYMIMEYVPGGSLRDLLRAEGALPVGHTMEIALDVADALTRAHRLNIVHRDLKPGNVLLAEDGTPRLSDFGIARVTNASTITQTGAMVGTLAYLSPEACNGEQLDARSDIWAFGVMLFEMLAGRRPFEGEQVAAIVTAILVDDVPDLEALCPDAPVGLVDLVYRMLEKDRDQRLPSMRQVGAELEAILHGTKLLVTPRTPSPSEVSFALQQRTVDPVRLSMKHDLFSQLTPFIGRELDLARLDHLVSDPNTRLVTIAAPGGMGKTRLAIEYATRQVGQFPNGVYYVPLAGLTRVEDIVTAIGDSIYLLFSPMGDRQSQLLVFLSNPDEQQMLLVLDNFEHLLDGADLLSDILRVAPNIKLLTTSRVHLNLSDEVVFPLDGMDVPGDVEPQDALGFSSVQLFLQGARRSQPGFELSDADVPTVLRIVRAVHGNPLGIVLAAAWVGMLSLDEIANEVELSLDFLQTDARDIPERQRSLRSVFESSWNMLTDPERDAFMKLSIFRGGVKRAIAQYITGASLLTLAGLVKKSLLRRNPETGRYDVHELLRQYAADELEQTGQVSTTRDIHCHYFISLMARRTGDLRGQGQVEALREIDADFENVRAAWGWAIQHKNAGMIAAGLEGVFLYCFLVSEFDDAGEMLREVKTQFAPRPGEDPSALWRQVAIRFELAMTPHADITRLNNLLDLAHTAGDAVEEAFCLWTLGYYYVGRHDFERALPLFEQSLAQWQALGDRFYTGRAMSDLGLFLGVVGQHEQSAYLLVQSRELQLQSGDDIGAAQSTVRNLINLDYLIAHGLFNPEVFQ